MSPRPLLAATVADAVTRQVRAVLDAATAPLPGRPEASTGPRTGTSPPGAGPAGSGHLAALVGPAQRWTRTNHRGEPVSLLEGPAVAAGLLAGTLAGAGGLRAAAAATVATVGGAAFGIVDDLTEDSARRTKGLRGHLGALARGQVTTGALKVAGIGASALAAATVTTPRGPRPAGTRGGPAAGSGRAPTAGSGPAGTGRPGISGSGRAWADVLASGALIAGTANLANLLDLRPGRALKAAMLCAGPLALAGGRGAGLAAAVVGAGAGALPRDLAGRDMLGDGGANAIGALLGTAIVLDAPRPVRLAALGVVVALTLASERVSFTEVIASRPLLRELDEWGRRPSADRPSGEQPSGERPAGEHRSGEPAVPSVAVPDAGA